MAFPSIASETTTIFDAVATSHLANYPATVNAGELLLLIFSTGWYIQNVSTPTGYDGTVKFGADNANVNSLYGFVKVAAGTEGGGTINVVSSETIQGVARIFRISGWYGTVAGVEFGTAATGSSANPDAPNLTPSWGALDTLWFAVEGTYNRSADVSSYPSGYSGGAYSEVVNDNGSPCGLGTAYKTANAASENPGTYTNAASDYWIANTVAVRPASAPDGLITGNNSGAGTSPAIPGRNLTGIAQRIMRGSSM